MAVGSTGTVYVADTSNDTLRVVTSAGVVSTLAGVGQTAGASDGFGSGALFNLPTGLALDASGNIYLADTANSTIRKIDASGVVTTFAGLAGIAGLRDGTGSDAWFNQPKGLTVDTAGNVYVADTGNASIRKITAAGVVTTLVVTPTTTTPPTTPTTPPPPPPGHRDNDGGGAVSGWFMAALAALVFARRCFRKK